VQHEWLGHAEAILLLVDAVVHGVQGLHLLLVMVAELELLEGVGLVLFVGEDHTGYVKTDDVA